MLVEKRNGNVVDFNLEKIKNAIIKANLKVNYPLSKDDINKASIKILDILINKNKHELEYRFKVEDIQDVVERVLGEYNFDIVKEYITYRYKKNLVRKVNTTDESILSLINFKNKEVMEENSNKNPVIASTQRDLIAGEVSKDLAMRVILPQDIAKAHKEGIIHYHDQDYMIQKIFNCCLVNIKDMFDNGFIMNDKLIETPKSFQTACTILTQIAASVASSQYGGQSINVKHLGKYLKLTKEKYLKKTKLIDSSLTDKQVENIVKERVHDELVAGIQTIQYQINTIMTTNG